VPPSGRSSQTASAHASAGHRGRVGARAACGRLGLLMRRSRSRIAPSMETTVMAAPPARPHEIPARRRWCQRWRSWCGGGGAGPRRRGMRYYSELFPNLSAPPPTPIEPPLPPCPVTPAAAHLAGGL
jgi:hypothetical protein